MLLLLFPFEACQDLKPQASPEITGQDGHFFLPVGGASCFTGWERGGFLGDGAITGIPVKLLSWVCPFLHPSSISGYGDTLTILVHSQLFHNH